MLKLQPSCRNLGCVCHLWHVEAAFCLYRTTAITHRKVGNIYLVAVCLHVSAKGYSGWYTCRAKGILAGKSRNESCIICRRLEVDVCLQAFCICKVCCIAAGIYLHG